MGFLADEAGALLSKLGGGGPQDQHNLLSTVLGWLNRPEVGGVGGIVDKFKNAGLGHIADGWVNNGPNPSVSADQLRQVLSSDQIRAFAQKLGIDPDEATQKLAHLLPGVIDHLTPNGSVPQGGIDTAAVIAALKAKIFGA